MSLYPRLDDLLELRHQARAFGLPSHHLVNSAFAGLYASVFRGAGLNFEEVRDYREGDDIRYMDWKVTARTNEPHMKIFREERERSVFLCVDKGPQMAFGTRGTFKSVQAARAAALLGWAASRLNDRVGGLIFGDGGGRGRQEVVAPQDADAPYLQHFRPARGRRALWQLLRALSEPAIPIAPPTDPLIEALRRTDSGLPTGSLIFAIGDFNREVAPLEQVLGNLCQRHTLVLLPIDDPADWEIPPMGLMTFRGPGGELVEIDTDDPEAQRRYRALWEERRARLKAIAQRLHILLFPVRTQDEIHLALLRHLEQRARSRAV
ncbi:DUF58 domain-containing protein [Caldichromatium japonicum]|uniref:DUF58 domain-containing protein n=1 Tax=Caldichromatium japonicum TaxID=2699430 RepID=A0A6G7VBS1_9GAMM|nr:DUF58 domain-containing protein [Caldichromatium japonicum]QIK37523.1 DUF58 domain-containing protein [Caldichromatium japonicum]